MEFNSVIVQNQIKLVVSSLKQSVQSANLHPCGSSVAVGKHHNWITTEEKL